MRKEPLSILTAGMIFILLVCSLAFSENDSGKCTVRYPEGYRQWTHVKTMVIRQGHSLYQSFGGIHHIYANEKALKAMKTGSSYPDGAVLIFDLLEAKSEGNAIVEGSRKVLGVMQRDFKRFKETGGWGFEGFKGDTQERVVTDATSACFSCHEGQKQTDYVFSNYRK